MNRWRSASIAHSTPHCLGAPQVSITRRHCRRCALQFPGQRLPQTQEPERRFPEWLSFAYVRRAKVLARCARIIAGSLSAQMNYWEIIADNLSKAGWGWGYISAANDAIRRLPNQAAPSATRRPLCPREPGRDRLLR